jgi:hypothetical protein
MNGDVYALAYNNNLDRIYIGGSFTSSAAPSIANAFTGICYVNIATPGTTVAFYTGVNVAAGGYVYAILSNDSDNSLLIGGSFTATFAGATLLRAAYYNGTVWQQLDTGFSNGIVYDIQPYRNGHLLVGTFTTSNSLAAYNGVAWYSGQIIFPMSISSLGAGIQSCVVSRYGQAYFGFIYTSALQNILQGNISVANNTGTVASPVRFQVYHNDATVYDFTLTQVINATQQTQISFKIIPISYREILTINTQDGTITSDIMGNQLRYVIGAGITNLATLPGRNYLVLFVDSTATLSSGTILTVAIWRQTYANIFDGINAK